MDEWVIYHNPRCGKSRTALELLEDRDVEPRVVLYLKNPPSAAEVKKLAAAAGVRPRDLVRTHEKVFREIALDLEDDKAVCEAIAKHPILLERPIVVRGKKAAIGRPPNAVLKLL